MAQYEHGNICGLPVWIGIARNDTVAYINDILLAVVNGSSAIFAFLSNLAIIIAIAKNTSLQKPSNIMLCSLATSDCFTGVAAQPIFIAWRFFLQRAHQSCSHQVLMFNVYYTCNVFIVGLSFTNLVIISFDRHYALSKPLEYRANATNRGAIKRAILGSVIWLLCAISIQLTFIFPPLAGFIGSMFCGLSFVVIPTVNHIRMLLAVRRHNSQMGDAVTAAQKAGILQRERKMAVNMCVVTVILLASLMPGLSSKIFELSYPEAHAIVYPWTMTVPFITSSINPVFYLTRNPNVRNAVKSTFNI